MSKTNPVPQAVASARLLVIRFSSFGDIVQAAGVPAAFRLCFPESRIDWLVREDFRGLVDSHPLIERVLAFPRHAGLGSLIRLAWQLAGEASYTHVYDAHNNLRSSIVVTVFRLRQLSRCLTTRFQNPWIVRRPKNRLRRWLLFRFHLRTLPHPFRGAESFLWPLRAWGLETTLPEGPRFFSGVDVPALVRSELERLPKPWIALAPSAAWEMKRWPLRRWKELIHDWTGVSFLLLGGPEDAFLVELANAAPGRTLNLAGRLDLAESSALLRKADLVIANDTGLLHVADQMERPTVAVIGPTAFGYPSGKFSRTVELDLACKPCSKDGRGRCRNEVYQRCLADLEATHVRSVAEDLLQQLDTGRSR